MMRGRDTRADDEVHGLFLSLRLLLLSRLALSAVIPLLLTISRSMTSVTLLQSETTL